MPTIASASGSAAPAPQVEEKAVALPADPNKPSLVDQILSPFAEIKLPRSVIGILDVPAYSFYLGAPSVHGVTYQPNFWPRIGVRLSWREWGTTLTFPLPMPEDEKRRRGDTVQTNIVLNKYWRQNAMDIYYQDFRGFYVSSPGTELSLRKAGRYPQLPDARVRNLGFNWYFAINPEKYSLRAAFSQSERQLESGGSWIWTCYYNHLSINLGANFIPGTGGGGIEGPPNLDSGHFDTAGFGAGYGYTYIRGHLFANAQLVMAPGLQYQFIENRDDNNSNRLTLAFKGNLNTALGWNLEEDVAGIKFLGDSLYSIVGDNQLWSTLFSGQIFYGRRF